MESLIKALQATTIPTILIWVGLFVLVLAFVTKIGGIIEVSPEQKKWAIPTGLFLLTVGLVLNLTTRSVTSTPPTAATPSAPTTASTPSAPSAPLTPSAPTTASSPSTGATDQPSAAAWISAILGHYENHMYDKTGGKNDYHYVTLSKVNDTTLKWENRAGVNWKLTTTADRNRLQVGEDSPYFKDGHRQVTVVWDGDRVSGLLGPGDELYEKTN